MKAVKGPLELFQMALGSAQVGALTPPSTQEKKIVKQIAKDSVPIFPLSSNETKSNELVEWK